MNPSLGNIYPIPESPAEEEFNRRHYPEISFSANEKVVKKVSSSSLPEKQGNIPKTDLKSKENSIPTLITTGTEDRNLVPIFSGSKAPLKDFNRLSVSLLDFSSYGLAENAGTAKSDKQNALLPVSNMISVKSAKSYLNIQDCSSYSNEEPQYETLLSPSVVSNVNSNQKRNSVTHITCQYKERKESDSFDFIDLDSETDGYQTIQNSTAPNISRQRASSMQWIQNAFQNVSNKYKDFLEFRRPSDIAEERMRKSKESLEMEESETEVTIDTNLNSSSGNRRFSENIIGKQKRFPFVGRLGHLKDLWKDRSSAFKRQEEKENDQTRADVCPLFSFPRKQKDEDEFILDTVSFYLLSLFPPFFLFFIIGQLIIFYTEVNNFFFFLNTRGL